MVPSVNGVSRSEDEPVEDLIAEVRAGRAERWAALAALAQSSDSRAYVALTEFAAADDWTVRRAAVEALGQRADGWRAEDALWAPECATAVLAVHDADPAPEVCRDAAYVLRRRAAAEWWPALVARWRDDAMARHRVWACELAAVSGVPTLVEDVAALVDDRDGHVRKAARAAIGRVGRPDT